MKKWYERVKDVVLGSDEVDESFDPVRDEEYEEPVAAKRPARREPIESFEPMESFESRRQERTVEKNKVVDFSAASHARPVQKTTSDRPQVVVAKLERFEDVTDVAKSINEKRMVIINLEDAKNDAARRIIDFIYGVTYANGAQLKRVAVRTYVVKPAGYEYKGDDGLDDSSMDGIAFDINQY